MTCALMLLLPVREHVVRETPAGSCGYRGIDRHSSGVDGLYCGLVHPHICMCLRFLRAGCWATGHARVCQKTRAESTYIQSWIFINYTFQCCENACIGCKLQQHEHVNEGSAHLCGWIRGVESAFLSPAWDGVVVASSTIKPVGK